MDSIRSLKRREDKLGVLMLEEELKTNDPDADERCGLLADRYEVFAIRIPGCTTHRLAASIDFKSGQPAPPVMLHGVFRAQSACVQARRHAEQHRDLINPTWET